VVSEFARWLFDPSGLTPHGFCLLWEPWLIWTHALSNVAIGLAYFSIPAALIRFVRLRRDVVFRPVFALFAAFILLCGTGHWADLLTIWWPLYGVEGLIKAATAAVSLLTAAALWPLLPVALAVPSPAQMRAANDALREAEDHLRHTVELNPQIPWTADPKGRVTGFNERWLAVTGLSREEALGEGWTRLPHPEDRARMEAAWARAVSTGEPYDVEMRLQVADGSYRWWRARAFPRRDAAGRIVRWYGATEDIHERKDAEERQALLAREVDHRAKNALAVVQSVLRLTPKGDAAVYAAAVEGRVTALARAQTLLAVVRWTGADLRALLEGELAPFLGGRRAELHGPLVTLPPLAAQPLAMALHELATNAVKHGALSVGVGRLSVSWRLDQAPDGTPVLRLRWTEAGGPTVAGAPKRRGFGSRVLDGTVRGQLGGAVSLAWKAAGLVCELEIPLSRVQAANTNTRAGATAARFGAPRPGVAPAGLVPAPLASGDDFDSPTAPDFTADLTPGLYGAPHYRTPKKAGVAGS
jgi:PAS domain S-box-containing protein